MCCSRLWITVGALLGGVAVGAGAFAAHGLDSYLVQIYAGETRVVTGVTLPAAQKYLADFRTAAEYQMYHALALIGLGIVSKTASSRWLKVAGWCFLFGTLIFSGCLYVLAVSGMRWLGAIVPIGGVLFLIGWAAFAIGAYPRDDAACARVT